MTAATPVARATCFQHPQREAAARCVGCGKSFCRECITALDRRMYCVSCFKARTEKKEKHKHDWFLVTTSTQFIVGLLVLWFTAYLIGRILVDLPTSFHEGAIWQKLTP